MIRFVSALGSAAVYSIPGIAIFVALFWAGLGRDWTPVLLYRGVLLACIAAVVHGAFIAVRLKGRGFAEHLLVSAISLAFAANLIFLVLVPVTIDRSVTVYLLGQLSHNSGGMTEEELNERLIRQYVGDYRGVHRRMQEQMWTGNVKLDGGRYSLTPQGKSFISFGRSVARIFGADPKYFESAVSNVIPTKSP